MFIHIYGVAGVSFILYGIREPGSTAMYLGVYMTVLALFSMHYRKTR